MRQDNLQHLTSILSRRSRVRSPPGELYNPCSSVVEQRIALSAKAKDGSREVGLLSQESIKKSMVLAEFESRGNLAPTKTTILQRCKTSYIGLKKAQDKKDCSIISRASRSVKPKWWRSTKKQGEKRQVKGRPDQLTREGSYN